MTEYDILEIEKLMLRIDESIVGEVDYVLHLDILELGSWVVKFRKSGIIVNHCDIVYLEGISIDASIVFKGHSHFWQIINGGHDFTEDLSKNTIKHSGNPAVIELFRVGCVKSYDPSAQQVYANNNASVPVRAGRIISSEGLQPLKAGFLLKKRDIFTRWRCRYFIVYPGKLEYYVDQHDIHSRASISLVGAEVQSAKRQTVNGVAEHWGLLVKTKNPDKTFRLASELTGMEGMVEANTWEQVFTIASKPSPSLVDTSHPTTPTTSTPSRPGSIKPTIKKSLLGLPNRSNKDAKSPIKNSGNNSSEGDEGTSTDNSNSMMMYASIIILLILLTLYVWKFSTVTNKTLYVTTSSVAVIALISIFVNQFLIPQAKVNNESDVKAGSNSSGVVSSSGSAQHAEAIAIIAEETAKKLN